MPPLPTEMTGRNKVGLTRYIYEEATVFLYNYFRNYDPVTGRYTESDSIGLSGGLNTYGYAGANPLLYSDPTGLFFDETGQFLKMCAQKAPVMAARTLSAAASGIALLLTPNSTAQCNGVLPCYRGHI
jgi:RHS repeat-associated protein